MYEQITKLWCFCFTGLAFFVGILLFLDLSSIWPEEARTILVGSIVLCITFGIVSIPFYCLQDRSSIMRRRDGNNRSVGVVDVADDHQSALKARIVEELFPGFPMDEETTTSEQREDGIVCAICLERIAIGDMTISGVSCDHHLFHRTCALQWLKQRDDNSCPTCRSPMWTQLEYEQAVVRQQQEQNFSIHEMQQEHEEHDNNNNNDDDSSL